MLSIALPSEIYNSALKARDRGDVEEAVKSLNHLLALTDDRALKRAISACLAEMGQTGEPNHVMPL
jgi:hypothetical protein